MTHPSRPIPPPPSLLRRAVPAAVVAGLAALLASCGASGSDPLPTTDLAFSATPTVAPTVPGVGEPITLTATVHNLGLLVSSASPACAYSVTRDGVANFSTGTVPALAGNGIASFPVVFTETDAGVHVYTVVLNSTFAFGEATFTNNSASVTVTVVNQVDMAVNGTPTVSPGTLSTTTAPITITVPIINHSTLVTATNVKWRIDRDGVAGYLAGTIPTLAPGASVNMPIFAPADPDLGTHTYQFTIDPDSLIKDPDRTNNGATITVTVTTTG